MALVAEFIEHVTGIAQAFRIPEHPAAAEHVFLLNSRGEVHGLHHSTEAAKGWKVSPHFVFPNWAVRKIRPQEGRGAALPAGIHHG
jgi:hypothetical protein